MKKSQWVRLIQASVLIASLLTTASALTLTSSVFNAGAAIPQPYTCYGRGLIPPLSWRQVPVGTASFVLVVDDPDAPHGRFTHWILYNLPAGLTALPPDISRLPGVKVGRNSRGYRRYFPPCPPAGSGVHHYHFQLYALDRNLALSDNAKRSQVMAAMRDHILATTTLVGTVINY